MKKIIFSLMFLSVLFILSNGCKKDSKKDTTDNTKDYALAAADFGGFTLQLAENSGPTNKWQFSNKGASGSAFLMGVDLFTYTYTKNGKNSSTLIFNVGGSDKYEMIWTGDSTGTFVESFNNGTGNKGVFKILK